MAIGISTISGVLQKRAPQLFEDAIARNSDLWNLFRKVGPSDAKGPRWSVKTTGESSAATFAEFGVFPTASQFAATEATLAWGRYVATLKISGEALDQLDAGNTLILNWYAEQLNEKIVSMVDAIDDDLNGGANTNGVTGITAMIDDDNTYAGVDRSSVTTFGAYVNHNSGTPRANTIALMDTTHDNLVHVKNGNYDAILMGYAQFDTFSHLTTGAPAARLMIPSGAPGAEFVAGYTGASYRGRPILTINGYTTGRVDFVQLGAFSIEVLRDFRASEPRRVNDDWFLDYTWIGQAKLPNAGKQAAALIDLS